jgi:hypothetical protein
VQVLAVFGLRLGGVRMIERRVREKGGGVVELALQPLVLEELGRVVAGQGVCVLCVWG